MPEPGPWELCDIGLVHHEKGVYWLGTTTGCSLLPFVRSNTAILNIPRPRLGSPFECQWDVEWSLYETRTYLEHVIDVFDHCEHKQVGDTRSETYALASRLTCVRVNSFMALEKSLKTLWSVGHKHDRPQFRHQVHRIFTDLPDGVRASLLMNLQDVRFSGIRYQTQPRTKLTSTWRGRRTRTWIGGISSRRGKLTWLGTYRGWKFV